MENIKIDLSPSSIKNTIDKLKELSNALESLNDGLSEELANKTLEQIQSNYSAMPASPVGQGFYNERPTFTIVKTDNKFLAIASSTGIVYEEFGTGDVGSASNHPNKTKYGSKLGLKDYNSGKTIRDADELSATVGITSGKYWTYNGEITQGIPAGLFMYNSAEWLHNNYKQITKEKVDDVLSKL